MTLLTDKILLLSLISLSHKKGWVGITKLQKLSFLIENNLITNNKRGFSHEFFMYDHGPMSKGIYKDFEFLLNEQLIIDDESGIRPSKFGENISEQFYQVMPEDICQVILNVIDNYSGMKTRELVDEVHNMKVKLPNGIMKQIDELNKNTTIIPQTLKSAFIIGKEYLETFEILNDKHLITEIRKARRKGLKSKPYVPLVNS